MCTLPGGGQLAFAAIIGHDGGVWASSAGFPAVSVAEVEAMMKGLDDPDTLAMTGILIGGEKVRPAAREQARGSDAQTEAALLPPPRTLTRGRGPSTSPSAASRAP